MQAPTRLWQFLGSGPGRPFVPFDAQAQCLETIRIPWPGLNARSGLPYPTVYGVNTGRRLGKTTMAEVKAWEAFLAPEDFFGAPTVRITADTEEHGRKIWDRFVWHAENTPLKELIASHDRSRHLITGKRGETIQLISADNPAALAGDGVTAWLIDEAQYLSYAAYENLFPSTSERDGVIVMFGVSEGTGPFREVCYKGDDRTANPEFVRLSYPTSANPFVPRWRIEFARRMYSPTRFKQLYMAEWADESGKIFTNVRGCVVPRPIKFDPRGWGYVWPHRPGIQLYGGLDLALWSDWTVYSLWDSQHRLVAWDRFSGGSWERVKSRAFTMSEAYGHPPTVVDATGVGDPIYDDLSRLGMCVSPFKISSNAKKRQLVDQYAIRVGAGHAEWPDIRLWITEHERFEAIQSRTPGSSIIQYSAPAGMTDDCVMSAALASWIIPKPISKVETDLLKDPAYTVKPEDPDYPDIMMAAGDKVDLYRQRETADLM